MQALSINSGHHTTPASARNIVISITVALLAALLLGSLLGSDWTLPMEPAISAAFTA